MVDGEAYGELTGKNGMNWWHGGLWESWSGRKKLWFDDVCCVVGAHWNRQSDNPVQKYTLRLVVQSLWLWRRTALQLCEGLDSWLYGVYIVWLCLIRVANLLHSAPVNWHLTGCWTRWLRSPEFHGRLVSLNCDAQIAKNGRSRKKSQGGFGWSRRDVEDLFHMSEPASWR